MFQSEPLTSSKKCAGDFVFGIKSGFNELHFNINDESFIFLRELNLAARDGTKQRDITYVHWLRRLNGGE